MKFDLLKLEEPVRSEVLAVAAWRHLTVVSCSSTRARPAARCEALGVPWYGPTFDS